MSKPTESEYNTRRHRKWRSLGGSLEKRTNAREIRQHVMDYEERTIKLKRLFDEKELAAAIEDFKKDTK